jgi:hypothetical protein
MKPNPFTVIIDKHGDVVETFNIGIIDDVMRRCQVLDHKFPDDGPHTSVEWNGVSWSPLCDCHITTLCKHYE